MLQRIYLIVLLSLFSFNSQAVLVGAGELQIGGGFSTIDYRFFRFNSSEHPIAPGVPIDFGAPFPNNGRIAASPQSFEHPDAIIRPDLDMTIYLDDGTLSNVVAQAQNNQTGFAAAISDIDFFFDTDYVAVISVHPLSLSDISPFNAYADERLDLLGLTTMNYEYTVDGILENGYRGTCRINGQLDGSYRHSNSENCNLTRLGIDESTSVPAPASIWTILPGIAGLLLISLKRKNAQVSPAFAHSHLT